MSFKGDIFSSLKGVISVVNELRDFGIEQDVKLPKIVVVGTQSSGKSSLLEQIVGLDFLPRGTGVVTRRPMEIRLQNVPKNSSKSGKAYFQDEPSKIYEGPNFGTDIKKRVEELTDQAAGKNKKIIDKPITITIQSDKCPDLTLIDLPGITKVRIENSDQPENIEEITTKLTKKYIDDPMAIILCVIPINQDISNSDALSLARQVDKQQERTFGVLTKVDIMDKGTNCREELMNKKIVLKHGYVAVKCRSQQDILANKNVEKALQEEKEFFSKDRNYRDLQDFTGTATLSRKLSKLLEQHINNNLPSIFQNIQDRIDEKLNRIKQLGEEIPTDPREKMLFLLNKFQDIGQRLNLIMKNKTNSNEKHNNEPQGDHRLQQVYLQFNVKLNKYTKEILSTVTTDKLGRDIQYYAKSVSGFLPFEALEKNVREHLFTYQKPSITMLNNVQRYLLKEVSLCIEQETQGSSVMQKLFQALTVEFLEDLNKKTQEQIENIFAAENALVFSRNPNLNEHEIKLRGKKLSNNQTIFDLVISDPDFKKYDLSQTIRNISQMNANYDRATNHRAVPDLYDVMLHQKDPVLNNVNNNNQLVARNAQNQKNDEIHIEPTKSDSDILSLALKFYVYIENLHLQISEQIPKIIECFLVQKFTNDLPKLINNKIKNDQDIQNSLIEDDGTVEERAALKQSLQQLQQAMQNFKKYETNKSKKPKSHKGAVFNLDDEENSQGSDDDLDDDDDDTILSEKDRQQREQDNRKFRLQL